MVHETYFMKAHGTEPPVFDGYKVDLIKKILKFYKTPLDI